MRELRDASVWVESFRGEGGKNYTAKHRDCRSIFRAVAVNRQLGYFITTLEFTLFGFIIAPTPE